ncbi:hypothetical protein [Leekyejoonella antrihumi]|uniref:Uncharacterized protein n=1 Tax=Leekyejoonella antrihumi TaxID=1660198 RepID=A0A563DVB5_9MICO|nr:hypothetical protein [Leekyejoonella antrihumi]TWP34136.1 hypothetical protein FGL98_18725 [Leekyejoonella antrihumi]
MQDVPRRAGVEGVDGIYALRQSIEEWLAGRGVQQWGHGEVPRSFIEAQVATGEWHVIGAQWRPAGALRYLRQDKDVWPGHSEAAAYVHGLMVQRAQRARV